MRKSIRSMTNVSKIMFQRCIWNFDLSSSFLLWLRSLRFQLTLSNIKCHPPQVARYDIRPFTHNCRILNMRAETDTRIREHVVIARQRDGATNTAFFVV